MTRRALSLPRTARLSFPALLCCLTLIFASAPSVLASPHSHTSHQQVLEGSKDTSSVRDFSGFTVYTADELPNSFPDDCVTALTATIKCWDTVFSFHEPSYHGRLGDIEHTDTVCDSGCGASLATWFGNTQKYCAGYSLYNDPPEIYSGGNMWAGWNETGYRDPTTGFYCNEVIRNFTRVSTIEDMPLNDAIESYSYYDEFYKTKLETVQSKCGISGDTSIPSSLIIEEPEAEDTPFCLSDVTYTTVEGDTCTSIALDFSVASAALYIGNQDLIRDRSRLVPNQKLYIPLSCQYTHVLQDDDTCDSIEGANFETMIDPTTGRPFALRDLNPWIDPFCTNLHDRSTAHGRVLCLTPPCGVYVYNPSATNPGYGYGYGHDPNDDHLGYGSYRAEPPENTTVAEGTTMRCGRWHTAREGETCPAICVQARITHPLFVAVNPSLESDSVACSGSVVPGVTYCTAPLRGWNYTDYSV
ncbi:hypothetical protein BJX65DRAFT_310297 [Aspergillus insuetus]